MAFRLHPEDCIAALASAPGAAERGIIRISGSGLVGVLRGWFSPGKTATCVQTATDSELARVWSRRIPWRTMGFVPLPELPSPLEAALHLWPGPRSYTGEALAELHLPGSAPLLELVLEALYRRGCRPAEPGEFTLRAFLAGRIDLTQAEAVLGVIDAGSDAELQAALEQLAGGLSQGIGRIRADLIDLLADLEAGLDFADEKIEFVGTSELAARVESAADALRTLRAQTVDRQRSRAGWQVVLAGPPNAGKSTLFNALVGRPLAIVSPVAGTTRDYLSAEVEFAGTPLTLIDTAGRQDAEDAIGEGAQRHTSRQLLAADLIVWCHPVGESAAAVPRAGERELRIVTKADLQPIAPQGDCDAAVCAFDPVSVGAVRELIGRRLGGNPGRGRQQVGSTSARTRDSLRGAEEALERAGELASQEADQDLLAIELRESLEELGKITGAVYTDDILDRIFSKFCIGK